MENTEQIRQAAEKLLWLVYNGQTRDGQRLNEDSAIWSKLASVLRKTEPDQDLENEIAEDVNRLHLGVSPR